MTEGLLLFTLANLEFSVRTEDVLMVEMVDTLTRVPFGAPFLNGITTVRGQVLPVISLRKGLGMPPDIITVKSRLVVVRMAGRTLALLVDTVQAFLQIEEGWITAFPAGLAVEGAGFAVGLALLDDRPVVLLDIEKIVQSEMHQRKAWTEEVTARQT